MSCPAISHSLFNYLDLRSLPVTHLWPCHCPALGGDAPFCLCATKPRQVSHSSPNMGCTPWGRGLTPGVCPVQGVLSCRMVFHCCQPQHNPLEAKEQEQSGAFPLLNTPVRAPACSSALVLWVEHPPVGYCSLWKYSYLCALKVVNEGDEIS